MQYFLYLHDLTNLKKQITFSDHLIGLATVLVFWTERWDWKATAFLGCVARGRKANTVKNYFVALEFFQVLKICKFNIVTGNFVGVLVSKTGSSLIE